MIAGVCAGLADYFAIDPVIVRVIFVLLAIGHGLGIFVYIVLWLLVPEKPLDISEEGEIPPVSKPKVTEKQEKAIPHREKVPMDEATRKMWQDRRERSSITAGLLLVALGAIFLIQNFDPALGIDRLWPALLLAFGLGMVWKSSHKS